jgi:hypothetical protein
VISSNKKANAKVKTSAYLNSLEGYGDDVDVKVDARKEDHTNEVVVKSELNKDDLGAVVDDKSKSSYMENLEHYVEEADKKPAKSEEPQENVPAENSSGEPEKLPQEEVSDEIGQAIDAALDDI